MKCRPSLHIHIPWDSAFNPNPIEPLKLIVAGIKRLWNTSPLFTNYWFLRKRDLSFPIFAHSSRGKEKEKEQHTRVSIKASFSRTHEQGADVCWVIRGGGHDFLCNPVLIIKSTCTGRRSYLFSVKCQSTLGSRTHFSLRGDWSWPLPWFPFIETNRPRTQVVSALQD